MLFLSGPAGMRGDGHALLAVFEHYMSDVPGTARNRVISTPGGAADTLPAPEGDLSSSTVTSWLPDLMGGMR
jgi:hypothetical protein